MHYEAKLTNCHQFAFFKRTFLSSVNYMKPRRITVYKASRDENARGEEIVDQWFLRRSSGDYKAVKDPVISAVKNTLNDNNYVRIVFEDF